MLINNIYNISNNLSQKHKKSLQLLFMIKYTLKFRIYI